MSGKGEVIRCNGCSVRFGKVTALDGINWSVQARETVCIVGPNGGGKSTLLKLILGLVKPSSGSVTILGGAPKAARMRMGYMPQSLQFDPLFPIDIMGIVLMGRLQGNRIRGYTSEDRKAAQRALEEVDLYDDRKSLFSHLSGGMKQRALIARALVNDPEILLLDEPTAMVDAHIEARLLERLRSLHQRMTILLVSHDATFVSGLVDHVLCVNGSAERHALKTVEDGRVESLYGESVQAVLHHHHSESGKKGDTSQ
jgi:zinc transport system ATP-binding protein